MPKSPPLELEGLSSGSQTSQTSTRAQRRAHVPASILQNLKLAAGDFVILRPSLTVQNLDGVSVEDKDEHRAIGESWILAQAWPSFSSNSTCQIPSALLKEISSLSLGDYVTVEPMLASNLVGAQALQLKLQPCDQKQSPKENNRASDRLLLTYLKQSLVDLKCIARGQRIAVTFQGSSRHFTIQAVEYDAERANANIGLVSPATEIHLAEPIAATDQSPSASDTNYVKKLSSGYDAIGGLSSQIRDIRELVELPLTRPDLYRHFAMTPPCGLLLWGPPGTGKTLLAHTIAASLAVPAFSVAGASLSSPYHGETEAQLRTVFQKARASAPSVVVLDEVDALAPRREDAGEVEKRVVAELLTLMDGLDGKNTSEDDDECSAPKQVMVIACTNRPNAIDPALRRPGRFDKEIEIGIPNVEARLNILEVLLRNTPHDLTADIVASFANRSHGFVGADLAALVDASCLCAIRRTVSSSVSPDQMRLTEADMESSFLTTRPSAMREVFLEVPKVKWEDIGGQTSAKQRLKESVEWPLTRKATIERLGFKPPAGVLLYGPPGCSKTLIAKAVATEAGLNFMAVKGPEIFNKFVGESERTIRALFQKARAAAPSVLFLDEIDAIATSRSSDDASTGDRVLTTLLTEMDGMESLQGVMVLAATNRPWSLDDALMRPGRLDRLLYVEPPDFEGRKAILRINLSKMQVDPQTNVDELAELSKGCSGAEMVSICQTAALKAMNEADDPPFIKHEHFATSAKDMRRGITRDMLQAFEDWRDQRFT